MKRKLLKIKRIILIVITLSVMILSGCNKSEEADQASGETEEGAESADEYSTYIKSALDKVSEGSEPADSDKSDEREVTVQRGDPLVIATPTPIDTPDAMGDIPSGAVAPDETADTDASFKPDETGNLTPDTFDVGTCCIYIDGETDSGYASELITALNETRVNMGYQPFTENTSLSACADRRAREITCLLSHTRPNGQPFYSLAPQYFKAEMLAIDGAEPMDTIRAWIRDEYSRGILFNTKYTSVGASCFKCNGLNCVVVAFGY